MFTNTVIALSAAVVLGAASMTPAMSAGTKSRAAAAKQAFAQSTSIDGRRLSRNPGNDVYVGGFYAGSDPDPLVRFELGRSLHWQQ